MYRTPSDRAACTVCGAMVPETDGSADQTSGWRACGRCWRRAVGDTEQSSITRVTWLVVGLSAALLVVWRVFAG